jgi:hypothetical protein
VARTGDNLLLVPTTGPPTSPLVATSAPRWSTRYQRAGGLSHNDGSHRDCPVAPRIIQFLAKIAEFLTPADDRGVTVETR